MRFPSLLKFAAQLLATIWKSPQNAEWLTAQFLRAKKKLTSEERQFISEIVFNALRLFAAADHCAQAADSILPVDSPAPFNKRKQKRRSGQHVQTESSTIDIGRIVSAAQIANEAKFGVSHEYFASNLGTEPAFITDLMEALQTTRPNVRQWLTALNHEWADICATAQRHLEIGSAVNTGTDTAGSKAPIDPEFIGRYLCLPAWVISHLQTSTLHSYSLAEVVALGRALCQSAPLTIRVNTTRTTRAIIKDELTVMGLAIEEGRLSPDALVFSERVQMRDWTIYQDGTIEVQDETSQLVAYAVGPAPHWRVVDACAGAGGKALHLATLQCDQGEVIALDVEYHRLKEIPHRARRAGLQSIQIKPIPKNAGLHLPKHLQYLLAQCDAVVVDAPCSGFGRARRDPMAKWRVSPVSIQKLAARQLSLLENYARLLKPGGVLVYSTCSLFPDENEGVIERFLGRHPAFEISPLADRFAVAGIHVPGLAGASGMMTFAPHQHGTDGFFIARLVSH